MKWLKHMTASWDDEKLASLVGRGGMEGLAQYGLYWRVNEIIASQMDGKNPSCSVRYPVTRWSLLLSLRGSLVFSALSTLAATYLVTVASAGWNYLKCFTTLRTYGFDFLFSDRPAFSVSVSLVSTCCAAIPSTICPVWFGVKRSPAGLTGFFDHCYYMVGRS